MEDRKWLLVPVDSLQRLTTGQREAYILFVEAVNAGRVVDKAELFAIYKNHVAAGEGERLVDWDREKNRAIVDRHVPWTDWEWERNFLSWFTRTLGKLLYKGYLRAVPAVDLSSIKDYHERTSNPHICQHQPCV